MAEMDPRELVGRRARRNAAWGPTKETYEIVEARRNRRQPAEIVVRLKSYKYWKVFKKWFRLRDLYLCDQKTAAAGPALEDKAAQLDAGAAARQWPGAEPLLQAASGCIPNPRVPGKTGQPREGTEGVAIEAGIGPWTKTKLPLVQ